MMPITRTLLTAAAIVAVAGQPAAAQNAPAGRDLIETSLETILVVCTSAVRDKFDFNDAAALSRHGLSLVDDASEAMMRENSPGIEVAVARFPDATVLVGYNPGDVCKTLITGDGHSAVRDRLVSELVGHNFHNVIRSGDGYQDQVFDFGAAEIVVRNTQGENNVAVTVKLKD